MSAFKKHNGTLKRFGMVCNVQQASLAAELAQIQEEESSIRGQVEMFIERESFLHRTLRREERGSHRSAHSLQRGTEHRAHLLCLVSSVKNEMGALEHERERLNKLASEKTNALNKEQQKRRTVAEIEHRSRRKAISFALAFDEQKLEELFSITRRRGA